MCGIAGIVSLDGALIPDLERRLRVMNELIAHRGPDGEGLWCHPQRVAGFAHKRLSIIALESGAQPMGDRAGNWLTFNGEIYNYIELRRELGAHEFQTRSDTEVILNGYRKWGADCPEHLRGMFAFAHWDEQRHALLCARDRFGIKPFYWTVLDRCLYFASEVKALLPFLPEIETDLDGFHDDLSFQFCLAGKTLFKNVRELLPGHRLCLENGTLREERYWEVYYDLDFHHTERYFEERLDELLHESVDVHLRSDVPMGAYVSGGLDSSTVASLASDRAPDGFIGFTGKFTSHPGYDESAYARDVATLKGFELLEADIGVSDFMETIGDVIYHLDYPVAGPGSFPQYMVSRLAGQHRRVVLGGQGGDEVFGGYTRYLIAYFEQCIKAAIDGTSQDGNFIVTYESIIPNLTALRTYKPLLQDFWRDELFEDIDRRYFRLINRAGSLSGEVDPEALGDYSPFETFRGIFGATNVGKQSYFDSMTHFDFKTLLPALLHVEDRMSMAHGLEARVPLLDHPLVEFAATMPSNVKFKDGTMKHVLKNCVGRYLPDSIAGRKDKMGFPVPLTEWLRGEANAFVRDVFSTRAARERDLIDNRKVLAGLENESQFGRKVWGFFCLEMWQQTFHDRAAAFRRRLGD